MKPCNNSVVFYSHIMYWVISRSLWNLECEGNQSSYLQIGNMQRNILFIDSDKGYDIAVQIFVSAVESFKLCVTLLHKINMND